MWSIWPDLDHYWLILGRIRSKYGQKVGILGLFDLFSGPILGFIHGLPFDSILFSHFMCYCTSFYLSFLLES